MKEAKRIVLLLLIIALATCCFVACGQKEPDSYDPTTISLNEDGDGIVFSHSDFTMFFCNQDDEGDMPVMNGASVYFSDDVGNHVVKVYAKTPSGKVVAEAEYTYKTVKVSLSELSLSDLTVSWTATAKSVSVNESDGRTASGYALVTGDQYTATKDGVTIFVKAEGGFDATEAIYYTGKTTRKIDVEARTLKELSAPRIAAITENVITWGSVKNASEYAVRYDGGDFRKATQATFSEEVGRHTISIKALGDGITYADSKETVISYETVAAGLTVTKTDADKATLLSAYGKYFVSRDGVSYAPLSGDEYVAEVSETVYFRSRGYAETDNIYYSDPDPISIRFLCPAQETVSMIDAAGSLTRWQAEKLAGTERRNVPDLLSTGKSYDGTAALSLSLSDASAHYLSTDFLLADQYDYLSFYCCGDGVSELSVTLYDVTRGIRISRSVGVIPAYWVKVTLRIENNDWILNDKHPLLYCRDAVKAMLPGESAPDEETALLADALNNAYSLSEILSDMTRLTFTITGDRQGAEKPFLCSEVLFGCGDDALDGRYQPLFEIGKEYVSFEIASDGAKYEYFLALKESGVFVFDSTRLAEKITGVYFVDEESALLSLKESAALFDLKFAFIDNGGAICLKDAASATEFFPADRVYRKAADLSLSFDKEENGVNVADWTTYRSTTAGWRELESAPLSVSKGDLRFATGKDLIYKAVYHESGDGFGLANTFSVDLGNYDAEADELFVKIVAIDVRGEVYYLYGTAESFESYPACDLERQTFSLSAPIDFRSLEIIVEYRGAHDVGNLYLDNLTVGYKADPSIFSDYPAPTIEMGDYALTFLCEGQENASFSYRVNGGKWTEGFSYDIPTDKAGEYSIEVRAVIGEEHTKSAFCEFTVERIYLSGISISIDEEKGIQTASWKSNGKISIKADKREEGGIVEGEYVSVTENLYTTDVPVDLTVHAEGYFDKDKSKPIYYFGEQWVTAPILVNSVLAKPEITATEAGFAWDAVPDANAYEVSINDGKVEVQTERTYPFRTIEGEYTLSVRSVRFEDGVKVASGNVDEYTYTVVPVSLSELDIDRASASWSATAYALFVKLNDGDFVPVEKNEYLADRIGRHRITVKAEGGFDTENHLYYYNEEPLIATGSLTVEALADPTILANVQDGCLYWGYLSYDINGAVKVMSIEQYQNLHPDFTIKYLFSINGTELSDLTKYPFPTTPGTYTVKVKALGNGFDYRESEWSEEYTFEVKELTLSEIDVPEETKTPEGTISNYSYTAKALYRTVEMKGKTTTEQVTDSSYVADSTCTLSLRAVGGYDEQNHVYYCIVDESEKVLTELSVSKKVIVPIPLSTPVLNHSSNGITWAKVEGDYATGYLVVVNGVSLNDGNPVTDRSILYATAPGSYTVMIYAYHPDTEQYPTSAPAQISYEVKRISLTQPTMNGAYVRWSYCGKLYISYNNKDWTIYDESSYNGEEEKIYLKVTTGYSDENDSIVCYVKDEQNNTVLTKDYDVNYTQLSSPELALNASKNGVKWSAVNKATGYLYQDLFAPTEVEIQSAKSSKEGWKVATREAGCAFAKDADGDHVLLIKAVGDIDDSDASEWRYSSWHTAITDLADDEMGTLSWQKKGFVKYSIKADGGTYSKPADREEDSYTTSSTLWIKLTCDGGYDEDLKAYYYGTCEPIEHRIVIASQLAVPQVNMTTRMISIARNADGHTEGYLLKITKDETLYEEEIAGWTYDGETGSYSRLEKEIDLSFFDAVGEYSLDIRAYSRSDPAQYPVSEAAVFTYSVRAISLSEPLADNENGELTFTAVGYLTVDGKVYGYQTIDRYAPAATRDVTVKVERGTDTESRVVYIGDDISPKTVRVIVPLPLEAPKITMGKESMTISAVDHGASYQMSTNNGESWESVSVGALSYSGKEGTYTLWIKASASDEERVQYPDRLADIAKISYTSKALFLSNISLSGVTFSWEAAAYSMSVILNGNVVDRNVYTYKAAQVGKNDISVTAEGGYRDHFYYFGDDVEQTSTVTISKLAAPTLSVSGSKIVWTAVSSATAYRVKEGNGAAETVGANAAREHAFSSQEGAFTLQVTAVGNGTTILDSAPTEFSCTIKQVSLSLSTVGSKAVWSSVANKTSKKIDSGSYSETTDTEYELRQDGSVKLYIKAEPGWNNKEKTYYYSVNTLESNVTVRYVTLAAPTLSVDSNKGIVWSAIQNAKEYSVRLDSGSYATQGTRTVSFSKAEGSHTVYVKAIATENSYYHDSPAAEYSYKTAAPTLTFLTESSMVVTWICAGVKAQYKTSNDTDYQDAPYSGYTASSAGSVSFRAVGGWDGTACVYYNKNYSDSVSKNFSLSGLTIAGNLEKGTSGWIKDQYASNKWEDSTESEISVVSDGYGAGSAFMLKSYKNSVAYRFGYVFNDMPASYKSLSFDIKLNEYHTQSSDDTVIRFEDSKKGSGAGTRVYADYNLKSLKLSPNVWYHVTIGFEDENLWVNFKGDDYTAPKVKELLGSESKFYEYIKAFDKFYITVKGSEKDGPAVYTYIDNICFSTTAVSKATATRIASTELTFGNGTVNANYTDSKWKQYSWGSNSYTATSNMLKIVDSRKILSLYTGYNTYKASYNEGGSSLGTMNHFSIDLGGDSGKPVSYRIELVKKDGSSIYVAGSATTMATLDNPTGATSLKTLNFNFTEAEIKSIIIYASTPGDGHLYMDNITLSKLS